MNVRSLHSSAMRKLQRTVRSALWCGQLDAADVALVWDTTPPSDMNVQAGAPAPTLMTAFVRAFVHYVSAESVMRQGMEFSAGDAILSFDGGFELRGRASLRYRLPNGRMYAQRNTARGLEELWDSTIGGVRLANTVMVRQRPSSDPLASGVPGEIALLTAAGETQLWQWDAADGLFNPGLVKPSCGVTFDWRTYGALTICFGTVAALAADAGGVHVKALSDTLATTLPRLEFRYAGSSVATLTPDGTLAATDFSDSCTAGMRIQNGADLFQTGAGGLCAASFSDDL